MKKVNVWLGSLGLWSSGLFASTGAIPTPPSNEQINSSQDTITVIVNILKTEVFPPLFIIIEAILIIVAIWTLVTGFLEARKTGDWGVLKVNIAYAAVCVTLGLTLAYFGQNMTNSL